MFVAMQLGFSNPRRTKGSTHFISFIHKLMRSRNQLQAVDVVELGGHLVAKQPPSSSRAHCPRVYVVGI